MVWTNGCFDVLHVGHLNLLEECRALGDLLVVGINGDASVRRLKGPGRPVNRLRDRARLLAALWPVDLVVPFRGRTPLSVLRRIKPDVYAKGGDYTLETMQQDERRYLESTGAAIAFLALVKGHSTTRTVGRVRQR